LRKRHITWKEGGRELTPSKTELLDQCQETLDSDMAISTTLHTTKPPGGIPEPMVNTPTAGPEGGAGKERGRERESREDEEVKMMYQNVGRGEIANFMLLQLAVEKEQ